jgi:hypothetical protein
MARDLWATWFEVNKVSLLHVFLYVIQSS